MRAVVWGYSYSTVKTAPAQIDGQGLEGRATWKELRAKREAKANEAGWLGESNSSGTITIYM
ncbi:hypothetical protein THAOC_04171, partial [Thalassiosira oceanica]